MSIEVISIGSSSSGNSYIIRSKDANIILDAGLTAKRIMEALCNFDISPESVAAVLITHEHVDHVRSIRALSRKCCNAVFIASRGTIERTENFKYIPDERITEVAAGEILDICGVSETPDGSGEAAGQVTVSVFPLSHDAAEPIGFSVSDEDSKVSVVTDTGIVTDEIFSAVADSDILVFEANHDEDLLMFGEYPYPVKVRIKSDHGHLSNRYAGEVLAQLLTLRPSRKPLQIMLAHLSFHNNAPFYARSTIESILTENGYERDVDYFLTIAARDEITTV